MHGCHGNLAGLGLKADGIFTKAKDTTLVLCNIVQLAGQFQYTPCRVLTAKFGEQNGQMMRKRQVGRLGEEIVA